MLLKAAVVLSLLLIVITQVSSVNNGLGLTPPMGWMAWERFRCNTDCDIDPSNCISEYLIKEIADRIFADGYKDAGYQYVSIDDCWQANSRNATTGRLEPDSKRFPSGIQALADYVHSKGLKLGIYSDVGTKSCGGYPGSYDNLELDAQTFAEWGVDMLKLDGCYANETYYAYSYPAMSKALNQTGRPILYSCSWPAYVEQPDYKTMAAICNIWRNFDDIDDSWSSVYSIIEFYSGNKYNFSMYAAPGSFNDPDQLIIGDYGLSLGQQKTQMAMWAIFASPLFISSDMRNIDPASKAILLNKNVIALNQDPLGIQGHLVYQYSGMSAYYRQLAQDRCAVAILHPDPYGVPAIFEASLSALGVAAAPYYSCYEAFNGYLIGTFSPNSTVRVSVNPSGGSLLMICNPL